MKKNEAVQDDQKGRWECSLFAAVVFTLWVIFLEAEGRFVVERSRHLRVFELFLQATALFVRHPGVLNFRRETFVEMCLLVRH